MRAPDAFFLYHPAINALYFALVLTFSMCLTHPAALGISLASALVYSIRLRGGRAVRFGAVYMLPAALLAAVINPAFSHEGATILLYLPSGNPLTLESAVYGVAAAAMLSSAVIWFSCLSEVITRDKLVYLFGRAAPALSLLLSMTLRFVPVLAARIRLVKNAVSRQGGQEDGKGAAGRARRAAGVLSAVVTWSLESAVSTADSMKSRGYGLGGRTSFSIYRFDGRDRSALAWLIICGAYIACGWAAGGMRFRYYPTMRGVETTAFSVSFMLAYLALCVTPVIIDLTEDWKWKRSKSKT